MHPEIQNVSVLDEIGEQEMIDLQAGTQGPGTLVTTLTCYGVSYAFGNDGNFCTATVECQNNCSK